MFTIGVLASGKGSNLREIINQTRAGFLKVRIGVVISDNQDAGALETAEKEGINNAYIAPGRHKTFLEPAVEQRYVETLKKNNVDLVCLAGFMRVVKKGLLGSFSGRVINIHPSLLPAFPGLEAWKQALDYGVKFAGCTVHYVEDKVDAGPIILQAVVPVFADDTLESLHQRIHRKEYVLYPLAIKLISEGKVFISGGKAVIK